MDNNDKSGQTTSREEQAKKIDNAYDEFLDSFFKGPQEVNKAFNELVNKLNAMTKTATKGPETEEKARRR